MLRRAVIFHPCNTHCSGGVKLIESICSTLIDTKMACCYYVIKSKVVFSVKLSVRLLPQLLDIVKT